MMDKVNEFFQHLIAYGGITIDKGIIYMWNDPDLFFPIKAFATLQHLAIKELGEDGQKLFYWLGHTYGKNASKILIKKFGFSKKDFDKFVNGATQDGFGYCKLEKTPIYNGPFDTRVIGTNSSLALEIIKNFGKQEAPIDHYLSGMIAGGSEPIFDRPLKVVEEKCMGKGDEMCYYHVMDAKEEPRLELIKRFGLDEEKIKTHLFDLYSNRKPTFKVFAKRDVKFGDGAFAYRGIKGVVFPQHMAVVMNYLLRQHNSEKHDYIMDETAKAAIEAIYNEKVEYHPTATVVNSLLELLSIFGLGEFKLNRLTPNKMLVINVNSMYSEDYRHIFGPTKETVDYYSAYLLKHLFKKYSQKNVMAEEKICKAGTSTACSFEITIE